MDKENEKKDEELLNPDNQWLEATEEAEEVNEEPTEEAPTTPHLQSLEITPSGSSTTNIPPRLPEGYSYNAPRPLVPTSSDKKKKKKQQEKPHPDLSTPNDTLRSEPSTFRHKKYRKKKETHSHTGRYIALAVVLLLIVAAGVSYPWWSSSLHSADPEPTHPVVAADTMPVTKQAAAVDTLPPPMTHEDSVHIQDSIRHAQWVYWQRRRKREQEQAEQQNTQEVESETPTASSSIPRATHTDSLH